MKTLNLVTAEFVSLLDTCTIRPSPREKKWPGENMIECRRYERGRARARGVFPPSRKGFR